MGIQELIAAKQRGQAHSAMELELFVEQICAGVLPDYQISAWLMAVYFQGMQASELESFTTAMWKSGQSLPRREDTYRIDKHSTGGVGDKTSLLLVPLVLAASEKLRLPTKLCIPMVSGRSLGHTGGTLDKLESVPGFQTRIPLEAALKQLDQLGFFMMGQTQEMAPADRILYALRDATHTVESLPLIVASILSKKLSESLNGLVLDVKVGSGAFLPDLPAARKMAQELILVAGRLGLETRAVISRMDEPLGFTAGNLLEMDECWEFLSGHGEAGLKEVTNLLAAQMLVLAGRGTVSMGQAAQALEEALVSRRGLALFETMLTAQGGQIAPFRKAAEALRRETPSFAFCAERAGALSQIDARAFGVLVRELGGGRLRKEDTIDPAVGVEFLKKVGQTVQAGDEIVRVYHRSDADTDRIKQAIGPAIQISEKSVVMAPWTVEVLGAS